MKKLIFKLILGTLFAGTASVVSAAEVNLYSERQPFLIDPLLEAFTKATKIKVNMVYIQKGMLERLKSEGINSPADLALTSDIGNLQNLVEAGVIRPTNSKVLEKNIPAQFRHPEGLWYGLTKRARVIYAHKKRVMLAEITSYADLANPKFKGRVCSRSGKHAYNVSLLAWIIASQGEAAAITWAKGVKANLARRPQGNDRAQVKAVFQGECDITLGNTYYMGLMQTDEENPEQKDWAASVNIIFPNQSGSGTHVNISGVAATKGGKNPKNAIRLIEFLSQDTAQKLYAEGNFEYPIKAGVVVHPVVASWGTFKADSVFIAKIAEHRTRATRIMDEVGYNN